jgi:hypothetical protein
MMLNLIFLVALAACALGNAHTVITYPGWRGNNLIVNETFPYGMQWAYPCKLSLVSIYHHHEGFFSAFCHETLADILGGGLSTSTNRTKWPVTGGAVAVQPGWFQGHSKALMYINLGLGTDGPYGGPPNVSLPMAQFEILGPSNNPYPGTFCLPQIALPANANVKVGDLATIQVVEISYHGSALYNVSVKGVPKDSLNRW